MHRLRKKSTLPESPVPGTDYKAASQETIKSLPIENDNEFQQVEMDVMALAEENFIEEAEVDAVLEVFVRKRHLMKSKNRINSKECWKRGDIQKKKDTHKWKKKIRYALQSEL